MIEAEDIELWSVGSKTEKDGFGVCRGWFNNQEADDSGRDWWTGTEMDVVAD